MSSATFTASVRQQDGKTILDLQGEINGLAEQALSSAYTRAEAENPATIALNFGGVNYINSTGIALIVGLLAQARKTHRNLVVYGLSEHYMEIFRITRLADFMTIHESEASALTN